jgi:hypothetical protein
MRTSIFLGLICVADALYNISGTSADAGFLKLVAWVFLVCAAMDVVDFFRERK